MAVPLVQLCGLGGLAARFGCRLLGRLGARLVGAQRPQAEVDPGAQVDSRQKRFQRSVHP